jgi:hypothetical protein
VEKNAGLFNEFPRRLCGIEQRGRINCIGVKIMRLRHRVAHGLLRLLDWSLERLVDSPKAAETALNVMHRLTVKAQDIQRCILSQHRILPDIPSFDRSKRLTVSIMAHDPPWRRTPIEFINTPAMITTEEARYFTYIGSLYQGVGCAVELGPWLGASTQHIIAGLSKNPGFTGKRLYVFDDFVWRKDWMDQYVSASDRLPHHACFRHLFDRHTANIAHVLATKRVKISNYDGNESLPVLVWTGEPIELLYVDCGRTMEVNQAWWNCLHSAFIPNQTLIIMQDWRTHRAVPRKWFNQTLEFTDSKADQLLLLHEVSDGAIATFLFTDRG